MERKTLTIESSLTLFDLQEAFFPACSIDLYITVLLSLPNCVQYHGEKGVVSGETLVRVGMWRFAREMGHVFSFTQLVFAWRCL